MAYPKLFKEKIVNHFKKYEQDEINLNKVTQYSFTPGHLYPKPVR